MMVTIVSSIFPLGNNVKQFVSFYFFKIYISSPSWELSDVMRNLLQVFEVCNIIVSLLCLNRPKTPTLPRKGYYLSKPTLSHIELLLDLYYFCLQL